MKIPVNSNSRGSGRCRDVFLHHSHDAVQHNSRGLGVFFDRDLQYIHTHTHTHIQKSLFDNAEQMFSLLQITSHSLTECPRERLGTLPHAGAVFRGQTLLPSWLLSYCDSAISSTFSSSGEQRWREAG